MQYKWVIEKYGDIPEYHLPKGYKKTRYLKIIKRDILNAKYGFNLSVMYGDYVLVTKAYPVIIAYLYNFIMFIFNNNKFILNKNGR